MKKLMLVTAFAILGSVLGPVAQVVLAPPALADGKCEIKTWEPLVAQGEVYYRGNITCTDSDGNYVKHMIYISVTLYKRTPGTGYGGWRFVEGDAQGPTLAHSLTAGGKANYRCDKDYQVRAVGWTDNYGEPGGHGSPSNPLTDQSTLGNTC